MMNDYCGCRLLWIKLKLFRQFNVDPRRIEQLEQLNLILEIRTRGIAKTETRTLVTLAEQFIEVLRIVIGDPKFLPNLLVPKFRERLGSLYAQPMKVEVVGVIVGFEELLRILAGAAAHGHKMKGDHVRAAGFD